MPTRMIRGVERDVGRVVCDACARVVGVTLYPSRTSIETCYGCRTRWAECTGRSTAFLSPPDAELILQQFVYVATGLEGRAGRMLGSDFMVTLPYPITVPYRVLNYSSMRVAAFSPTTSRGDRTPTAFRVVTDRPLQYRDHLTFTIIPDPDGFYV